MAGTNEEPITGFHDSISRDPESKYPAQPERYHLYVAYACPWASRCLAYLKIKGLEKAISFTSVKPILERTKPEVDNHMGWVFSATEIEEPGAKPDPLYHAKTMRQLYDIACPQYAGAYSVPVLWDAKRAAIVNNDSGEIIRMLNTEMNEFATHPEVDLYPPYLQARIDETNEWIYTGINKGVYKCGFAKDQETYDQAVKLCFESLDICETILEKQRYICGHQLTEADVRLFVSLIRFDEVYAALYNCNKKLLREYPNLFDYTKDIYQIPGISSTVKMVQIKKYYYKNYPDYNPMGIIPIGPNQTQKFFIKWAKM
ncbi:uncharacterized protein LOC126680120 [Mercurialis annua]|uniref:uncharacterized protein LOC126680120 n=1 Tax=Mercurialis annua TaxID=3986 RepID=UPI00215ED530|nr:uncharacterized protein LOC126680120 [Mercurialis annua]XP_055961679.1 uncharacterized protein LOC126680120 [Mercurialis annua]